MIPRLFRRRSVDARLDQELRFHLDQHTSDLIARGHTPDEARRLARVALGGLTQVTEELRDVHRARWIHDAWQDARYALRLARQRPGFAAAIVAMLALGIGATTAMFTVVNGVLLRPLPFPRPEQLLTISEQTDWSTAYGNVWAFAYPNFLDCEREARTLTPGVFRYRGGTITGSGDPEFVDGYETSASLWRLLGSPIAHGRAFHEDEDAPGGVGAIIISHDVWQRRYAGSSSALGATLIFEGMPYTVVGVTPPGFQLMQPADVYVPIGQNPEAALRNRSRHPGLQVWARLAPGVTLDRAQGELGLIGRRLEAAYPESNRGRTFVAEPLRPDVGDVGPTLWLLLGAVGLVLVIACVNIASLLLARALSRRPEIAMRAALGASRRRLIRQCLTESSVLALAGGALGVLVATVILRPFVQLWPGTLARAEEVHLDWRVLVFSLAVSLASGLLFGLVPALDAPRNLDATLRSASRSVRARTRRWHAVFVMLELALAVVLLACAAILGRTLLRASTVDSGVNVHNVLISRMALSPSILTKPAATRAAWEDVIARALAQPGVQHAAIVDTVPMRAGNNQLPYSTTATLPPEAERPLALATSVTPGYAAVMGLQLIDGRFFDDRDRMGGQPVVVIDDILARRAFGTPRAAGRQLWVPDLSPGPLAVVGVVGHVRHWGLASDDRAAVRAQVYYPFAQLDDRFVRRWSQLMSLVVRTTVPPAGLVQPLRHALRGTGNDQVLYGTRTLEDLARDSVARERFLLVLFAVFAGAALLLACLGVYGVLAFLTSRRTAEIAVRLALGATSRQVIGLVVAQGLPMVGLGVAAGVAASLGASRVLTHALDSVHGIEPATLVAIVGLLTIAAVCAMYLPARRASRVDAATALRLE